MRKKWTFLPLAGILFLAAAVFFFYNVKVTRLPVPVPLEPDAPSASSGSETFAGRPLPENVFCDRIVVRKSTRTLTLYRETEALKSYRIALGAAPVGHKEFEGDQKTPEGLYHISGRNPKSDYHLSLRISYPNPEDIRHAEAEGKSPGGDIMIHGLPNGAENFGQVHSLSDWTAGCLAVDNAEIEELWRAVPDGTAVEIRP